MISTCKGSFARKRFDDGGFKFCEVMLTQILQSPKTFHAGLLSVVSTVSRFKRIDDAKQLGVFGLKGCSQSSSGPMTHAGNQLPLVNQVGIAPQG